jgi:hypothetical protein
MLLVFGLRTTLETDEGDMLENFMAVKIYSFGKRETFSSVFVQR